MQVFYNNYSKKCIVELNKRESLLQCAYESLSQQTELVFGGKRQNLVEKVVISFGTSHHRLAIDCYVCSLIIDELSNR